MDSPRLIPSKIITLYAIVSSLWIFFSDSLLTLFISDLQTLSHVAMIKGWLFVVVTSILLFFLIKRYVIQINAFNAKLLESERRFRELMERVHMIAIILDTDARVTFCNDFLLHLTDWNREEVIGRNWFDTFIPESIRSDVENIFHQGISRGEIVAHHENNILTRSGNTCIIVWDNTLLRDATGTVTGIACLGLDVTEHRNIEAQLLQSQKMESIGTLAGGVAHDFNNILTVIMSCVAMLRSKPDDQKRNRQLIDLIDSSSQRAANLTRNLLAFSRKQHILMRQFDLNSVISSMHDFLKQIIGEDVTLTVELFEHELPVLADQGQIEQVVMNLVGNARDAMPEGGILKIQTGVMQFDRQMLAEGIVISGNYVSLKITDSGIGIAPCEQKRIYEPFYTTKEVGKGTGLGLSMAHGIIRQHNGWITMESEIGKGTSFTIYLPRAGQAEASPEETSYELKTGDGTILLVEDDEQVLSANILVLESGGYKVISASNPVEALEIYRRHIDIIDLAVIDAIMPNMNGKQLYDELKKISEAVRVIFVSGYAADTLDRKNLSPGCAFLQKPYPPQQLLQLIHELLGNNKL